MPYYSILHVSEGKVLSTFASDRSEALTIFGKGVGETLCLAGKGRDAQYQLEEWDYGDRKESQTVPVFGPRNLAVPADPS